MLILAILHVRIYPYPMTVYYYVGCCCHARVIYEVLINHLLFAYVYVDVCACVCVRVYAGLFGNKLLFVANYASGMPGPHLLPAWRVNPLAKSCG